MSKKVNDVNRFIEERKAKRKDAIAKVEDQIRASKTRLDQIEAEMDKCTDAERYRELARAKIEETSMVEFFEMRKVAIEAEGLSDEEYSELLSDCRAEFASLKAEYAKKIFPAIDKMIIDFGEYQRKVMDLNGSLRDAGNFAGRSPQIMQADTLVTCSDPNDPYHYFLDAYNRYMNYKNSLQR